mgnify:CR=1 FL=1
MKSLQLALQNQQNTEARGLNSGCLKNILNTLLMQPLLKRSYFWTFTSP